MTDDPTRSTDSIDPTERVPAYDPGPTTPIEAAPVAPVLASNTGPNRVRWAVGAGVAGLAATVAIGAILLLGASPSPEALRYIPGNSALVAELRLDLPGDQMQKVGNLLAHFPGFRDQATLPEKLDEAFTRLVGVATDDKVDFQTDLKPWLNGPAFVGVPAPASSGASGPQFAGVLAATTNGAVDCATALEGTVTHETYRGLDLVIAAASDRNGMACVVDGRQALLGDPAGVRAGIDAKVDGTGMDQNEKYQAARAALGGDRIATAFVSGSALTELIPTPSLGTDGLPGLGGLGSFDPLGGLTGLAGAVPEWTMVGVRAEDNALVVDTVAAPTPAPSTSASLLPLPATHGSTLAGMLPGDTVLFVENQGAGVALQNLLATIQADPQLGSALAMLDGLGGAGELVGWIEDAGIAVVGGADTHAGGVLLVARDDATAAGRLATLKSLLGLLGLGGGGVEVRESTVNGVEVTTVVITDVATIIPPGTLPDGVEVPATGPIEFSIAVKGRVLLVGVGEPFMTGVLNVQPGSSLADQAAYKQALQLGLANSRTSVYVGVPAALDLAEGFVPAATLAQWQSDVLPYLEPIEVLAISASSDAAANRSRIIVTVTQP